MPNAPNQDSKLSPIELIDGLIEQLREKEISGTSFCETLEQLKQTVDRRYTSPEAHGVIEDAIQRSPWLTSDAERVKQYQSGLIQMLESCCRDAQQIDETGICAELLNRLSECAEKYVESESARAEFLHTAFPGPDWTD